MRYLFFSFYVVENLYDFCKIAILKRDDVTKCKREKKVKD